MIMLEPRRGTLARTASGAISADAGARRPVPALSALAYSSGRCGERRLGCQMHAKRDRRTA
jgi:hypothetical protein